MIKSEVRGAPCRVPRRVGRIVSPYSLDSPIKHRGEYHTHRVTTWIATGVAEGANLLETDLFKTRFFKKFSGGGILQRLILVNKAPRESPQTFERFAGPLYQQHLETITGAMKKHYVYGKSRTRMFVAVLLRTV